MDSRPIGIFDSGIGGLTVANAIRKELPNESLIYFGDTSHLPYGDKSADAIRFFSLRIAKFLLEKNCKLIVIACNSASSSAYDTLIDFYDQEQVIFLNVIDPLVQLALEKRHKKIGIIATKATINSGVYFSKLKAGDPLAQVSELATPLLAPMIEEGFHNNAVSESIISNYLNHEKLAGIETLLLACTHYPLVKDQIEVFFNGKVDVLDPNEALARQLRKTLDLHQLHSVEQQPKDFFYVSDFTQSFQQSTNMFYSKKVELEEALIWK